VLRRICRNLAVGLLFVLHSGGAWAQDPPTEEPEQIHWALASLFGTGWYSIDGNRSVYVLRAPMRWTLKETEFAEGERQQTGLELHVPVTVGYHQVDELGDFINADNFSTLSIMPGLEFEIPLTRDFWLRPFVLAGYGAGGTDTEDVWLLNAGIKSRYRIEQERGDWDFLGNVYWGGYREINGEESDGLGGVLLGVERSHAFKRSNYNAHLHFSYTYLGRPLEYLEVLRDEGERKTIDDFITVGLAFSPKSGSFDFELYRPHQLGLALEFDPEGNYFAIKFNSRSWFTR
jgi:hypothetical protein